MRILVAEDDASLAEFLHQRLVREHFAVQVVSDGTEAQRLAFEQSYDLVLLDLSRPEERSGLDVLRSIRAKRPDLPVLIVTAASMVEERVRGLDAGADDYIGKPFAFAELAARIRAVADDLRARVRVRPSSLWGGQDTNTPSALNHAPGKL